MPGHGACLEIDYDYEHRFAEHEHENALAYLWKRALSWRYGANGTPQSRVAGRFSFPLINFGRSLTCEISLLELISFASAWGREGEHPR